MGILFLPARQERCSSLLSCSAVQPLPLLRLRPRLTPTMATATPESTVDSVLATAVVTPASAMDLDMEATATLVLEVTTASVRLRLKLRLILTTDTATLDSTLAGGATEDTDTAWDTAVATPPLDTPDLDTAVGTTVDSA